MAPSIPPAVPHFSNDAGPSHGKAARLASRQEPDLYPIMSEELTDFDVTLGSGIAAFEAKHFSPAIGLLSPLPA